jgi:hypothetical protein
LCGKERNFTGEHLWARGYAVSTLGFELEQVRQYIRDQEGADGTGGEFRRGRLPKAGPGMRSVRGERQGHTLQPTALVSQVYLRLVNLPDHRLEGSRALLRHVRPADAARLDRHGTFASI